MAKKLRFFLLLTLIFSINLLSACATMPEQKDLEISLRKTAKKYWDIRMKKDLKDLYDMEFRDNRPPLDKYMVKAALIRKFHITKQRIKTVEIQGTNAAITFNQHIMMPAIPAPLTQTFRDLWIWDRKWKHIFDPRKYMAKHPELFD